ncbi:hypothetical protein [Chryseobacterium oryctis]|uniref:Uncharacterized protein n=1 Tax=Chryseobacterium oryctis TaxID=2952618 RepID=A0ABT3HRF9_9FLAO|nr:hypothetical protein [Chryseobacterium oryctis]MCW3162367.1 hypothetical protein [Chryseobacterium oryctis]
MCAFSSLAAQKSVGINTDSPKALLDISSKSIQTPENSAGILFPTVNHFTSDTPGADQNGMLVFLDNNNEGAGFEGLYFWDNNNESWQYIFQSKILDKNLFKTMVTSPGFPTIPSGAASTNIWYKTVFSTIEAPNANYTLSNGDLIIGKTGNYSLLFTGGITKGVGETGATSTEVGVFINNSTTPTLISKSPIPSADNANRSTSHTISSIITLTKGQRISIQTRRTSNSSTDVFPASIYTLTLSYLD